ncbi:response regulator [Pedobacter sp. SYSU D00535]|uniref:response regulator n=1 Tax=Pedobacter sp. SYSU D00535 TaxID=2810308 RepID=UPI001A96A965|nr:response regulator [Pedobacter sp. SYSU D00535]
MKQVLIIDDDPRNIFALKAVLKSKGYTCVSAGSAPAGLSILAAESDKIGIILMDMMMPEMDGYEALSHIRNNGSTRDVPVIAVTAQAMVGDKEKCLNAGATDYMSKPINLDTLLVVLEKYLK